MTNTHDVIISLKQVKEEKNLSLDKILEIMTERDPSSAVSKTTLSRVFRKGSEDQSFNYEGTLRPIANALLDIETIESDDDIDTQAYKSILKLKMAVIDENSKQIAELKNEIKTVSEKERQKYHEKMEKDLLQFQNNLTFLKEQISLKDKRIDQLLDANDRLTIINDRLSGRLLDCPCRKDVTNDK